MGHVNEPPRPVAERWFEKMSNVNDSKQQTDDPKNKTDAPFALISRQNARSDQSAAGEHHDDGGTPIDGDGFVFRFLPAQNRIARQRQIETEYRLFCIVLDGPPGGGNRNRTVGPEHWSVARKLCHLFKASKDRDKTFGYIRSYQ